MAKIIVKSPEPGHCLASKIGSGMCRDKCGQPKNLKLKCPTRGGRWYYREVEL